MAKTKNYKNKKGATGKQYTTYGDRIKVTYTDGSTRVVRPTDASYKATKKAMESDIAGRNPFGIGNKKSTTTSVICRCGKTGKAGDASQKESRSAGRQQ